MYRLVEYFEMLDVTEELLEDVSDKKGRTAANETSALLAITALIHGNIMRNGGKYEMPDEHTFTIEWENKIYTVSEEDVRMAFVSEVEYEKYLNEIIEDGRAYTPEESDIDEPEDETEEPESEETETGVQEEAAAAFKELDSEDNETPDAESVKDEEFVIEEESVNIQTETEEAADPEGVTAEAPETVTSAPEEVNSEEIESEEENSDPETAVLDDAPVSTPVFPKPDSWDDTDDEPATSIIEDENESKEESDPVSEDPDEEEDDDDDIDTGENLNDFVKRLMNTEIPEAPVAPVEVVLNKVETKTPKFVSTLQRKPVSERYEEITSIKKSEVLQCYIAFKIIQGEKAYQYELIAAPLDPKNITGKFVYWIKKWKIGSAYTNISKDNGDCEVAEYTVHKANAKLIMSPEVIDGKFSINLKLEENTDAKIRIEIKRTLGDKGHIIFIDPDCNIVLHLFPTDMQNNDMNRAAFFGVTETDEKCMAFIAADGENTVDIDGEPNHISSAWNNDTFVAKIQ